MIAGVSLVTQPITFRSNPMNNKEITVSKKELDIMRHSVGHLPKNKSYRNHYYTGTNDPDLCGLVEKGLMQRLGQPYEKELSYFSVTDAGWEFLDE